MHLGLHFCDVKRCRTHVPEGKGTNVAVALLKLMDALWFPILEHLARKGPATHNHPGGSLRNGHLLNVCKLKAIYFSSSIVPSSLFLSC